jgi:hypothetical protein
VEYWTVVVVVLLLTVLSSFQLASGMRIADTLLKRTYDFDDLFQVFVCDGEGLLNSIGL